MIASSFGKLQKQDLGPIEPNGRPNLAE